VRYGFSLRTQYADADEEEEGGLAQAAMQVL